MADRQQGSNIHANHIVMQTDQANTHTTAHPVVGAATTHVMSPYERYQLACARYNAQNLSAIPLAGNGVHRGMAVSGTARSIPTRGIEHARQHPSFGAHASSGSSYDRNIVGTSQDGMHRTALNAPREQRWFNYQLNNMDDHPMPYHTTASAHPSSSSCSTERIHRHMKTQAGVGKVSSNQVPIIGGADITAQRANGRQFPAVLPLHHGQATFKGKGIAMAPSSFDSGIYPSRTIASCSKSIGITQRGSRDNGQEGTSTDVRSANYDGANDFDAGEYDESECSDSEDSRPRSRHIPVIHMTFSSETSASRIPFEIWDMILDCLAYDPMTLLATELVCKAWRPRSALHLEKPIAELEGNLIFEDTVKVYRCAKILQAVPRQRHKLECVVIETDITHLHRVASTCANITPRLSTILLESLSWKAGAITHDCFKYLSAFTSVENLLLESVTMPSISEFGRLVCAFTGLVFLSMDGLKFTNTRHPPLNRRWALPPGLEKLELKRQISVDAIEALRLTKLTVQCNLVRWYWLPLGSLQQADVKKLLSYCKKSLQTLDIDLSVLLTLKGTSIRELVDCNLNLSKHRKLQEIRLEFSMNTRKDHDELANVHNVIFSVLSLTPPPALQIVTIVLPSRQLSSCTDDRALWTLLYRLLKCLSKLDSMLMSDRYQGLEELDLRFPSCLDGRAPFHYSDNVLVPKIFPNLSAAGILQMSIERPFPR